MGGNGQEDAGKGEIIQPSEDEVKGLWNLVRMSGSNGLKKQTKNLMDGFLRIMEEEGVEPPSEM